MFTILVATALAPRVDKTWQTVVTSPDATPAEARAAQELATTLAKVTGAPSKVTQATKTLPDSCVVVGRGKLVDRYFPSAHYERLGDEESLMTRRGSRLLLTGGRPRGTLYAVSRFLQRHAGVRYWTPWATTVPKNPRLAVPKQDDRHKPAFEYRDPYWYGFMDGDWQWHNFANGMGGGLDASRGGKTVYGGFVHTFYGLVPPEKYFATHPEYFSLVKGKRTAENAQLCTTNQAVRDIIVERVKDICRRDPSVNIVSVSQNDCFNPCECPACKAVDDREGSHAGTMVELANYVADHIRSEFPKVAIDTLAYQYSRKPPRSVRPRPNVIVRLCSIECDFGRPLDGPSNKEFAADLRGWNRLTDRLYVWDYVTNFAHYVQPFPNYRVMGPNLRFFASHGVKGVFEEGAYQSSGSEMTEMRAWVLARLMDDPGQDDRALTAEFLNGYYGAAGPHILHALDRLAVKAAAKKTWIYDGPDAHYLDFDTMLAVERDWRLAAEAVAQDAGLTWRVKTARLAPHTVWLRRWDEFRAAAASRGVAWPLSADRKAFAQDWLADALSAGPKGWTPMTVVNEGGKSPQQFVAEVGG
ncbi:MAG: DUF4838 domain-containing protein [Fimbriimonadaceae bacterium]|nr:DUF4838 domain-containing protein [Fimbriimonadaceae bacterium]